MDDRARIPRTWSVEEAFLFVAGDFGILALNQADAIPPAWTVPARALLALAFTIWLTAVRKRKFSALGIGIGAPWRGMRASILAAAGVAGAVVLLGGGVLAAQGLGLRILPDFRSLPDDYDTALNAMRMMVVFPVLEEWIYRGLFMPAMESAAGRWKAVIVSGIVFQALHIAYGIYLPHYFIGGMILGWAFMEGRSLVCPILLHAAWNGFVFAANLAWARGLL